MDVYVWYGTIWDFHATNVILISSCFFIVLFRQAINPDICNIRFDIGKYILKKIKILHHFGQFLREHAARAQMFGP